jgi:hypothetical protein
MKLRKGFRFARTLPAEAGWANFPKEVAPCLQDAGPRW